MKSVVQNPKPFSFFQKELPVLYVRVCHHPERCLIGSFLLYLVVAFASPVSVLAESYKVEKVSVGQEKVAPEAPAETAPESIRLKYAWPKDKSFQMKFSFSETTKRGKQKVGMNMNGTSTVSTENHEKGLKIKYTDTKIKSQFLGMGNVPFQKKLSKFLVGLGEMDVQYVIGENGDLLDVVNFDEYQKHIKDYLDGFIKEIPKSSGRIRILSMFNQLTSRQHLLGQFQKEWNKEVGQWIDAEMERGFVYEIVEEEEIPILPGTKVPFTYKYSYLGKIACVEGGAEKNCVELQMEAEADPKAMTKVMDKFLKEFEGKKSIPPTKRMSVNTTLSLITEPDTLLPHRSLFVKKIVTEGPDGNVSVKTEKNEGLYTYSGKPEENQN